MKEFFLNDSKLSMGRLLSLIVTICGVLIGLILAFNGKLDTNGVALSLGLVGTGIAGKVIAK